MANPWLQPQQNPPTQQSFFMEGTKKIHPLWRRWFQDLTRWSNSTFGRIYGTANQVIVTDNGDGTITFSLPQDIDIRASVIFAALTLDNTGLHLLDTDASHDLIISPGSNLTIDRTLTLTTGDADRIITLLGDPTLSDWFDQSVKVAANVIHATLTLNNSGLHILDTDASHDLIFAVGSDLTADRTLTLTTGDSDRIITLLGNPTLDDWFDQSVKVASSPTFAGETLTGLNASQLVKTDAGKTLASTIATVQIPICMDYFDAVPERGNESNWHGGILSLATGQPLDSVPTDLPVTKGIGKILIVINAGSDLDGEITITGETIDRNTGASTLADTDTITVDALTTDGSTVDSNGNTVHTFVGAYISSKWFTGAVVLSTADLTLTDVDVYHLSFEQVNDSPDLVINTFDANVGTTNVAAEFDAYLYTVHVTGDKCNIDNEADIHVGADGETAITNKYWRLRRGGIDEALDGTTDGFWVDVHYSNSPVYVEDVTISVWLTKTVTVELS